LTAQLLAFARKQHMQAEPTDLNALVSGMGDLLVRTIGSTVRIETSLQHGLWPAMVDASQVELIILNLALNARDAMPEGGLLRIATRNSGHDDPDRPQSIGLAGDFASVTVSDTELACLTRLGPRRSGRSLRPNPLEPAQDLASAKSMGSLGN
jgi:signal transduction histidine kinase